VTENILAAAIPHGDHKEEMTMTDVINFPKKPPLDNLEVYQQLITEDLERAIIATMTPLMAHSDQYRGYVVYSALLAVAARAASADLSEAQFVTMAANAYQ
jgi:hypothetical protein